MPGKPALPQDPAGVDVHGAQHVDAFDEQPAIDDLRLRPVAVARQDALV